MQGEGSTIQQQRGITGKGIKLKSNCLRLQLRSSCNGIYSIWERRGRRVRREIEKERERMGDTLGRSTWTPLKTAPGRIFRRTSCRPFFAVFHLAYLRISSPVGACASVRARFLATYGRTWDIRIWFTPRSMLVCPLTSLWISPSRQYFWKNNMHRQEWYKFRECHGEISRVLQLVGDLFVDFRSLKYLQKWIETRSFR